MARKRINGAELAAMAAARVAGLSSTPKKKPHTPTPKTTPKKPTDTTQPDDIDEGEEVLSNSLSAQKDRAIVRKTEAQAKRAEYELDILQGKYIAREDLTRELVGRALVLDLGLRHRIKDGMAELIEIVNGDQSLIGQANEVMMTVLDDAMTTYASIDDFIVEVEG